MTTETLTFNQDAVYTHPNIRNLTHDQLHQKLDMIRNKRLITAMEFKTAQEKRMDKEGLKLSEQWAKLRDRTLTRMAKVNEELDKAEGEIRKLIEISNQLSHLEG